jgi:hypothetical protein
MSPEFAAAFVLTALPALVLALVLVRTSIKRALVAQYLARFHARLAGAEWLERGCFRWQKRVYRLEVGPNPIFESRLSLRLSTFCDGLLETEIRAARNVPTKTPQRLADDAFYSAFVLDAISPDEAVEWFLAVKKTVTSLFPARWGAVTHLYGEISLSANGATYEDLEPDLVALAELASVRAERKPRGGTWTLREGFEPHPPGWHWKPEQREALPPGTRRWCVSCWYDNSYLNAAIVQLLWRLAGDRPKRFVTGVPDLEFLEHGFGVAATVRDRIADLPRPEMAIAADQGLDGDFFSGFIAGETGSAFAGALKLHFHDRAIALLPKIRFCARRLFDDEFSWFNGEYEILSCELRDDDLRAEFDRLAAEFGARVVEIERPFSFKLLKEDRLEIKV